ncbi:MAG: hypothetical protein IJ834_07570 [Paludibacteraceae bacterium]|nr:hypothetical protein [Paludibacteraceae bacterium]
MKHNFFYFLVAILFAIFFAVVLVSCNKNEPDKVYHDYQDESSGSDDKATTYQYYPMYEPCIEWGMQKQYVKQKMKQMGFIELYEKVVDSENMVYYKSRQKEKVTILVFGSLNDYKYSITVFSYYGESIITELDGYLDERYNFVNYSDYVFLYRTKDGRTDVQMFLPSAERVLYDIFVLNEETSTIAVAYSPRS